MKRDYVNELESAVAKVWGEHKDLPGLDRVPRQTLEKITKTLSEQHKQFVLQATNGEKKPSFLRDSA